ncbi:dTDP-4-dehydrorhamnose reductase [Roseibium salinum]|uniref:dTDP-4-dehydrorhamnose reductase n=1 Tax=Roseibium salinum TaxID=1604349 RepID=A0ABT3R0U1_9HYPH|nr:dTDP-4-dehydrorhamnose reductase [Roseibium sp. DSM 29163]MCX2722856.1 dTDP-4-dehydrorhamnose reductase [Roseibium sp. DSM 29163]MDN3719214.1 dTDP-4-dehydrorhamnose reductase [Roseibium salinum]
MIHKGKILVAGKSGQLARSLEDCAVDYPEIGLHLLGRPHFDITSLPSCQIGIAALRPDIVINAAAFTDVDGAESNPAEARRINVLGAKNLAKAAASNGIPVIHISTDYVFDGTAKTAYAEFDRTNPINVYGQSKLEGEQLVRETNPRHLVLRTAWLYSPFGVNFVSKVLKAAAGATKLSIVDDQIGNPTSALDLAHALLDLCGQLSGSEWDDFSGIYHLAGPISMSRHELAQQIMAASKRLAGPSCEIRSASTADFPTPATRPLRTALDTSRYRNTFGLSFPQPDQSLTKVVGDLLSQRSCV